MKNPGTLNKYFLYKGTVPYTRFIIAQVWYVIMVEYKLKDNI